MSDLSQEDVDRLLFDLYAGQLGARQEQLLYDSVEALTRWQMDLLCVDDCLKRSGQSLDNDSFKSGRVEYALAQLRRAERYLARAKTTLETIAAAAGKSVAKGETT